MKHVILGAGPAGVIAAETIRKHAPDDRITARRRRARAAVLAHGDSLPADGQHRRGGHLPAPQPPATSTSCASSSSAAARTGGRHGAPARCTLDDGSTLPFDTLLIATGSQPDAPADSRHRPARRAHLLDAGRRARHRGAAPAKGARVLQMGAGFIGCIIMEALAARGVQLTVVEMGDRMVPRMMGPTAGGMIKRLVREARACGCSPARASRPSRPRWPTDRAARQDRSAVGLAQRRRRDEGEAVQRPDARGRPGHQRHRRASRTSAS